MPYTPEERERRLILLRRNERIARGLHTWYGDVIAAIVRWWRIHVLQDDVR